MDLSVPVTADGRMSARNVEGNTQSLNLVMNNRKEANKQPAQTMLPTPVNAVRLGTKLAEYRYPQHLTDFLLKGLRSGFSTASNSKPGLRISHNLASVQKNLQVAKEKINQEILYLSNAA